MPYAIPSNISLISSGVWARARIVRVVRPASASIVRSSSTAVSFSKPHFGYSFAASFVSIHVANPSFSHRLSHHAIVTRSPNHWCAISCATTSATSFFAASAPSFFATRRSVSRNVMHPKFSIAPASKSGTATRSSFATGYLIPKYRS